ncbi:Maf family protein [Neptunomonas japonica]|uniref:Maf family protein n=1 Tax=Neptunomonas japonica TaxID=417574 RepID=UPI0004044E6F|nr:nucleoside triphosphate pyrophosphatase [Neptunomonas japonica]
MQPLVLASSSPYRRILLDKLQLPYSCHSPDIDESPYPGENATQLVMRLAAEKARAVADQHPGSVIIGSDQVAVLNNLILGKPGTKENARTQLQQASGQRVTFLTGLCTLDTLHNHAQTEVIPFYVHFRELTAQMIENYIDKESPLDCAGSFKSEGLGIALFEKLEGEDPNALVGLPLIRLISMLNNININAV